MGLSYFESQNILEFTPIIIHGIDLLRFLFLFFFFHLLKLKLTVGVWDMIFHSSKQYLFIQLSDRKCLASIPKVRSLDQKGKIQYFEKLQNIGDADI